MSDRNLDMTPSVPQTPGDVLFRARLTPYRSLTPRGFAALMMAVALTCLGAGLLFWSMGAWPIAVIFGLNIVVIQLAFRLNYRSARACEIVEMTEDHLTVHRIAPNGRAEAFDFNPYWARLEVERVPDWGIVGMALASHGKRLAIGSFLNPDDRESFAAALTKALASRRHA